MQNKLVSIGEDVLIYPRENNRILKYSSPDAGT